MNTGRCTSGLVVAVGAAVLLCACSGSSSGGPVRSGSTSSPGSPSASSSPTSTASGSGPPAALHQTYVSVGDSYAAGYQPTSPNSGTTTRNGFAYQAVSQAAAAGYDFTLVNFACSGATTTSVLQTKGCAAKNLGPGATPYDTSTQAVAAQDYLRTHRGQVGLVTVSVGGNDVTSCAALPNPIGCVTTAVATVKKNLTTLVTGLRRAAGPTTEIVGITYPDVLLGDLLSKSAAARSTANLSVIAFQSLINPTLQAAYQSVDGKFVDVTQATGGFGSLSAMTTLAPYGTIPVPVAKICTLTYYCQFHDIHPRTPGYAIIAKLVVAALPKR